MIHSARSKWSESTLAIYSLDPHPYLRLNSALITAKNDERLVLLMCRFFFQKSLCRFYSLIKEKKCRKNFLNLPSMISFVALFSSIRISRKISAFSASSSCELAMDKPSPLTCFKIVSSLALPNLFLDGRGDSEPLFVVPLFVVLDCAPALLPLNLCGNVLDFSHGRD